MYRMDGYGGCGVVADGRAMGVVTCARHGTMVPGREVVSQYRYRGRCAAGKAIMAYR